MDLPWDEPTRSDTVIENDGRETPEARFSGWLGQAGFWLLGQDIASPLGQLPSAPDFWVHAASTTHPVAYSTEPVNTIRSNVLGSLNMLDKAAELGGRFLALSSVEIYGQAREDTGRFAEADCGYIDCNTLRAGYPEAKRLCEALCQAYIEERGTDAMSIRLPRCYGPTMQITDSKAVAQFIKKAVAGEDIILKSQGIQLYSFAYVADAVLGILWVLAEGRTGETYNLADERSDATLRAVAGMCAQTAGTKVSFDLPEKEEAKGFSKAQRAVLDGAKLKGLGWKADTDISAGISETIKILREIR